MSGGCMGGQGTPLSLHQGTAHCSLSAPWSAAFPLHPRSGAEWSGLHCSKGGSSRISGRIAQLLVRLPTPLASTVGQSRSWRHRGQDRVRTLQCCRVICSQMSLGSQPPQESCGRKAWFSSPFTCFSFLLSVLESASEEQIALLGSWVALPMPAGSLQIRCIKWLLPAQLFARGD